MANQIKCPHCGSTFDSTNVTPGTTIRCPQCGGLVRIPTGSTGKIAVQTSRPAIGPRRFRGHGHRQTALFRKMSGVRGPGARTRPPSRSQSETEDREGTRVRKRGPNVLLIVGLIVGVLGLVVVLVIAMAGKGDTKKKEADAAKRKAVAQEQDSQQEYAPQPREEKDSRKPASVVRNETGKYEAIANFEKGAKSQAEKIGRGLRPVAVDEGVNREYEGMAEQGKVAEIVKNDSRWMAYVINGIISDNEKVSRYSYQALHDICEKHKDTLFTDKNQNPIMLENVNSAYVRGTEYNFWSEWWEKSRNQQAVREWGGGGGGGTAAGNAPGYAFVADNPANVDWERIMKDLRSGCGYEDTSRPEGFSFQRVKAMGKGAYPFLVRYIDNEDILLGRAAVSALNNLTGRTTPIPTEANKVQIKSEWDNWVKSN